MPLEEGDLVELDRARQLADEVMSELMDHPAVQEAIRRALMETGLEKKLRLLRLPSRREL
jgi:hypothetical protein